LSGGESRSVDLALQFAFLDVARIQAQVFPDILILDELLDSSVDATGLISILNIIKARQKEDDSKIFLVTHRTEISNIEVDNVYMVEKREGFSHIRKM
jgi:energy-coupling factor transporter ATP-binding protein EcfA2